ncbi:MAG: PDZ domain-containing protein, partial [Candidatus Electryoneaceae bacterium]|nr:PDZ domain-containing protein [Candidatus Electryoneaceae bacterium]
MNSFRLSFIWIVLWSVFSITSVGAHTSDEPPPGFFRYPHTDGESIVFTSEGDLWKVSIGGGTAIRLTTHEGDERFGHFSSDGLWIAFSGQDDGQDDIYVMPSAGGEPRRLTYHPGRDMVIGWSPDGNVLFRSSRTTPYRAYRIFSISPDGGYPEPLGLDKGSRISFEPDGERIAFNRYSREFSHWKRYKGGWASDIWIGNMETISFQNITDNPPVNDWDGTDAYPMWFEDGRIYYLSDRPSLSDRDTTRANIFSMKSDGSDVRQHTFHETFDVRWPSLGNDLIVYQNGMDIWKLDLNSGRNRLVSINLPTDRVQARVKFINPRSYISSYDLSPDGKRVLFCSRGELFTAPANREGLIRQLTFSSGAREKAPKWSPDGETIVAWSDISGEEELYLYPATGGEPRRLGTDEEGWHYGSVWSPDGEMIAFSNQKFELIVMKVRNGDTQVIDRGGWEITDYSWSADSRFLAYSRQELNYNSTIQIWDVKKKRLHSVTDDYYNSYSPRFDPEGQYLYFLSDRIANPHIDSHDEIYIRDRSTRPYVVGLQEDTPLPFIDRADPDQPDEDEDEENGEDDEDNDEDEDEDEPVKVKIDFVGLADRIAPFPVPADNYLWMQAVKGKIFYLSYENDGMMGDRFDDDESDGVPLHKFDIKDRKHSIVEESVNGYDISRNGERLLIRKGNQFFVMGIDGQLSGEDEQSVQLSAWDMRVDVRAEWRQIFYESWRLQRDFFWDPNMHDVDWEGVWDQYRRLAPRISTRDELNDLIGEMFAELNCSHTYVWGGDQRRAGYRSTGLLGVDVVRHESGFYRIERVIPGKSWNPGLLSPLTAP